MILDLALLNSKERMKEKSECKAIDALHQTNHLVIRGFIWDLNVILSI